MAYIYCSRLSCYKILKSMLMNIEKQYLIGVIGCLYVMCSNSCLSQGLEVNIQLV